MRDKIASDKINTKNVGRWLGLEIIPTNMAPSVICMQPHSIGKVFTSKEGRYMLISFHTVLLTVQCTPQSRQIAKLFLQLSELGLSHPLSRRRVSPPPRFWGEDTLACVRGVWGSPNSNEGTYTVVLFIL